MAMTMRLVAFVVAVAVLLSVGGARPTDASARLLRFAEGENGKRWVNQTEYEKLIFDAPVHNFLDVTEFDYESVPVHANADPIPTQPVHVQYVKEKLLPNADVKRIVTTINSLSAYHTRYYTSTTGVDASKWLQRQYSDLSYDRSDISVANFTYSFPQISTIATIAGSGPHKDSIVVIGGHLDSVGSSSTGRAPGADDDASGSSTVLEVYRVLAASDYKPDYTLQFIGYAAEEAGLLGSQGIANAYAQKKADVYAVLQFDMTGYSNGNIGIITDNTDASLTAFVRTLTGTYTNLQWTNTQCGYGCSDHASWTRAGYRSAMPFESLFSRYNPYIHSANDVLANLNQDQMLQFAYLGIGFAVELAGIAPN